MTTYFTIPPPAQLKPFVRAFWVFEMDVPAGGQYIYRSLADGCPELVLHYEGRFEEITPYGNVPQARLMLQAQSQQYRRFITHERFGIFGVYIYPFALRHFFKTPASALSNEMPAFADIDRAEAVALEEQLMCCLTNHDRVRILSHYLTQRLAQNYIRQDSISHAVSRLVHHAPTTTVAALAADYGLSARQFERRFKENAGFSPKLYMRIMRFQDAIKRYGQKGISLTGLAYECGYYDQSHFIHDFRHFSGYHPRHYFGGSPEGSEYRDT